MASVVAKDVVVHIMEKEVIIITLDRLMASMVPMLVLANSILVKNFLVANRMYIKPSLTWRILRRKENNDVTLIAVRHTMLPMISVTNIKTKFKRGEKLMMGDRNDVVEYFDEQLSGFAFTVNG
ncbi:hypothetical protein WN943_019007 [Citrus x changshan-huyou]